MYFQLRHGLRMLDEISDFLIENENLINNIVVLLRTFMSVRDYTSTELNYITFNTHND